MASPSGRGWANSSWGTRRAVSTRPVSWSTRPHWRSPAMPSGPTSVVGTDSPIIDFTG